MTLFGFFYHADNKCSFVQTFQKQTKAQLKWSIDAAENTTAEEAAVEEASEAATNA